MLFISRTTIAASFRKNRLCRLIMLYCQSQCHFSTLQMACRVISVTGIKCIIKVHLVGVSRIFIVRDVTICSKTKLANLNSLRDTN